MVVLTVLVLLRLTSAEVPNLLCLTYRFHVRKYAGPVLTVWQINTEK